MEAEPIPRDTGTQQVWSAPKGTFREGRIAILLAGAKKDEAANPNEVCAMRAGGGCGSFIGRDSFQREGTAALRFVECEIHNHREETP